MGLLTEEHLTAIATLPGLVRTARSEIDAQIGEARRVVAEGRRVQERVNQLRAQRELHDQVTQLLTGIGETRQEAAQRQVEELVTRALQTIFSENLSFALVPSQHGGQSVIDFVLRSEHPGPDGPVVIETPVLEARGGGMAVVVAFVLRLVVIMLTPGARRLLVLDESFGHVSAEYEPRVAEFLREVADKAGVQIVLVTHSAAFSDLADAAYRLELGPDGATRAVAERTPEERA